MIPVMHWQTDLYNSDFFDYVVHDKVGFVTSESILNGLKSWTRYSNPYLNVIVVDTLFSF